MKSHIRFDKNLTKVSDPVAYPCVLQLQNKVRTLVPHVLSPFEITHHYLQKKYILKSILCIKDCRSIMDTMYPVSALGPNGTTLMMKKYV